jgi:hypothetical protein
VNVPLNFLGNPTIPVVDSTSLPAVIEPYALVFAHEEAVSFTSAVDRAPDYGFAGANWAVCVPTVTTVEDDDPAILYSEGWHKIASPQASAQHFTLHAGRSSNHFAVLNFNVPQGSAGKLTYFYATSRKGGSADIVVDGATTTVNYRGNTGGLKDPAFGARIEFANLAAGPHWLQIRNMNDGVYIDKFILESSSPVGRAETGPGATSTSLLNLTTGQQLLQSLPIAANASAVSVVAESTGALPIRLLLLSPTGSILQTSDSENGVAVLNAPVSQGVYVVKVVNLNLGPVQVWTATTQFVRR